MDGARAVGGRTPGEHPGQGPAVPKAAWVAGMAAVLMAATVAPGAAQETAAPGASPEAIAEGPLVQAVEDGVWRLVTDGAGHTFSGGDTIVFAADGSAIVCCGTARVDGEEVSTIIRVGQREPFATLGMDGRVSYPGGMVMSPDGRLWVTGQGAAAEFDGQDWVTTKVPGGWIERLEALSDGSVWAAVGSLGRPGLARFTDDGWASLAETSGFTRLAGKWDEFSSIKGTPDGAVWVAVGNPDGPGNGRIARFDGSKWEVQYPLGKGRKAWVDGITAAPDGSLWAYLSSQQEGQGRTERGPVASYLARYDGHAWTVLEKADGVPAVGPREDSTPVFMESGPDGRLWVTPRVGFECVRLVSFDGSSATSYLDGACVKHLAVAPDGAVWMSAEASASDGPGASMDGIFIIPPPGREDYFSAATEIPVPRTEEEALLSEYRIGCRATASTDEAGQMCDLLAPFVVQTLHEAVEACGGSDPETDGEAMCLGFVAPMLLASLVPPPWRDGMDVALAASYLELAAAHQAPANELASIQGLEGAQQAAAWQAAAYRDESFARAVDELEVPGEARVLAEDTVERWRALASSERALALDPQSQPATDEYLVAIFAARYADTELRWILGLPPSASTAMARLDNEGSYGYEEPEPTAPPVRVLVHGREGHTSTMLEDGRVLLAGGDDADYRSMASTEAFDPATGRFGALGRLKGARTGHVAIPLVDGSTLVVGGRSDGVRPLTSVEVVDAGGATSRRIAGPRGLYQPDVVAPLDDGRVLVVGPARRDPSAAWLFDPTTTTFCASGSPVEPRGSGTATTLDDGTVLLVGGGGDYYFNDRAEAELFDPGSGTFVAAGRPIRARMGHTATTLSDGTVLIVGGTSGFTSLASAELFDPTTRRFVPVGVLEQARSGHTATLLEDGQVLITGGSALGAWEPLASAEVYDPETRRFRRVGALTEPRENHAATRLAEGRVLITGGGRASGATAEFYDPTTETFRPVT